MYYLGSISGASGAYSNQVTGVSGVGTFPIPQGVKSIYLQASHTGVGFQLFVATGGSGSTFQTDKTKNGTLDAPAVIMGPFRCAQGPDKWTVVSIYNPGDVSNFVSVRIWSSPTS